MALRSLTRASNWAWLKSVLRSGVYNRPAVELRAGRTSVALGSSLLRSNEKRFRGGLVFKARRLLYHSTLGESIKEEERSGFEGGADLR